MSVYVDDFRKPAVVNGTRARWSHMMADTHDELTDFASKIGLRPDWIQHEGSRLEHFDVTDSKRKAALDAGAIALHGLEGGYLTRAKCKGETFDLAAVRAHRASLTGATS